jgi:hypothetical protein
MIKVAYGSLGVLPIIEPHAPKRKLRRKSVRAHKSTVSLENLVEIIASELILEINTLH